MDDVIVRLIDMPVSSRGIVAIDDNGDYNVYLNPKHSNDTVIKAYKHELRHIRYLHFYDDRLVKVKEVEAQYGKTKENEIR